MMPLRQVKKDKIIQYVAKILEEEEISEEEEEQILKEDDMVKI